MTAISELKNDIGAVFEEHVLFALKEIRNSNHAEWQRIRSLLKKEKVNISEIDNLTILKKTILNENETSIFPTETIWPNHVDGAQLLDEIVEIIKTHIIADIKTIQATALWIVFTWFIDVVNVAPIENITAPERRCGKSEMLAVLGLLVFRPLITANMGPAPMFRIIDKYSPTLLIDEIDSFLSLHDDMRGILNAGFTRSAPFVYRCVGDNYDVKPFSVWGAKALCGIGGVDKLPTLADRSIPIRLRRKLNGEKTIKVRHHNQELIANVRAKLLKFSQDAKEDIRSYKATDIPEWNDRANDCWEPLLAIAHIAGGNWPKIAVKAAITLHGITDYTPTIGEKLLCSIKDIFQKQKCDRIRSIDLLDSLFLDDESPWSTWNQGEEMTPYQLGKQLSEYGITSKTIRFGDVTAKGFKLKQFTEVFKRYITTPDLVETVTSSQPLPDISTMDFGNGNTEKNVTDLYSFKVMPGIDCVDVTDYLDQEEL